MFWFDSTETERAYQVISTIRECRLDLQRMVNFCTNQKTELSGYSHSYTSNRVAEDPSLPKQSPEHLLYFYISLNLILNTSFSLKKRKLRHFESYCSGAKNLNSDRNGCHSSLRRHFAIKNA